MENQNTPIPSQDSESAIENIPTKKNPGYNGFTDKF